MNADVEIKKLLRRHWALRFDMVGEQSVDDLIQAIVRDHPEDTLFRRIEGGADFDLQQSLEILVEAATFLKTAIEIYTLLSGKLERKPTAEELQRQVETSKYFERVKKTLTADKIATILRDIIG